ncbi:MAG: hypothetical protein ACRDZ1_08815 [Acidimicrobiia bacterium]
MARLRRAALCLAAFSAALSFVACSSDTSGSDDSRRGESRPRSQTSQKAEWSRAQQAALATYEHYIDVVDKAFTSPLDPLIPEIEQYATPELAQEIRQRIAGYQLLGRAVRPSTFFEPETITIERTQATIVGCLSDFGVVYEVATGTVIDDERVQEIATTVVTRGDDGQWRVMATDDGREDVPCHG